VLTISQPSTLTFAASTSALVIGPSPGNISSYLAVKVTPSQDALSLTITNAGVAPGQVLFITNIGPNNYLFFLLGAPVPPGSGLTVQWNSAGSGSWVILDSFHPQYVFVVDGTTIPSLKDAVNHCIASGNLAGCEIWDYSFTNASPEIMNVYATAAPTGTA
jgi:hypothetical protein